MTPAQTIIARYMSEAELMANVVECAQRLGWRVAHINDALYREAVKAGRLDALDGAEGFPDLVMAREGRVIFVECKSARGKLKPMQRFWLADLDPFPRDALHDVYVWRPSDWLDGTIESVLRGAG